MLEGPHLVGAALDAGIELDEVLASPRFLASSAGRSVAHAWSGEVLEVEPRLLDELADSDSPRGLVAVARWAPLAVERLPRVRGGIYVLADGLQDPGNLGALARVAEAMGAAALAVSPGSAHPSHPRAMRASTGSLLRLPTAMGASAEDLLEHLRAIDGRLLALVPRGGAPVAEVDLGGTVAIALGAEGPGLAAETARLGTGITIPLAPAVESLNVSVAAGIVLHAARQQRSIAP